MQFFVLLLSKSLGVNSKALDYMTEIALQISELIPVPLGYLITLPASHALKDA